MDPGSLLAPFADFLRDLCAPEAAPGFAPPIAGIEITAEEKRLGESRIFILPASTV
ncbi:MAG TPA: hypothetical protein VE377_17930 [Candidatus Dormibacteraeota bacterium]|nr:hypothetical protein [Candidatus Dormibacteraeota bacterium]